MCVIIAKPAGVEPLDEGYFERAWNHNGDGGGVVYKSPDKECCYVQKGFMKKEDMLEKLREINKKENSFIAHFRIKSVGEVKPENTHPFVMDRVTFAHNGTITSIKPLEGKTDSETFGLLFLKTRSMKWIKENQLLLEIALGSSKFAIMDNKTGEIFILNKENGKEQDGAWFSNSSADKPVAVPAQRYNYCYNDYRDYDNWRGGELDFNDAAVSRIKARSFFGTKSFVEPFSEYKKENGFWTYTATGRPTTTYPFSDDLVVAKNGLWKINPQFQPKDFGFDAHEYKHRAPEFKMVAGLQRELQKDLAWYWKQSFPSADERTDYEKELCCMNIVLDAARRFIRNGVELSLDNLTTFVMGCMTYSTYAGNYAKASAEQILDYAQLYISNMFEEPAV